MSTAPQVIEKLEEAANRLAGESVLAAPGSDDGLIPAYSLLGELSDLSAAEPGFAEAIQTVRTALETRLDTGKPFDAESLGHLLGLVEWLPEAIGALRAGVPLPPRREQGGPPVADTASESKPVDVLLTLDLGDNRDLLAEFHGEAVEHLQAIEAALLSLEQRPEDPEALGSIFRSFHTIKGNAGFLGLAPMHALAHEVETLLDLARNHKLRIDSAVVTEVLRSRDAIQALTAQVAVALERGEQPGQIVPVSHLIEAVRRLVQGGGAGPAAPRALERTPAQAGKPEAAAPDPMGAAAPASAVEPEKGDTDPSEAARASKGAANQTVRVSTEKLDLLMDVVGELVIVQSQLAETAREVGRHAPRLAGTVGHLGRIAKELQHAALSLRMIPIKPTFQKMERLARDVARECGKKAAFLTEGGQTELDRTMVEDIADPLVHMVRNALDHGVESPEERVAAGKPEQGTVTLRAFHRGGSIHIQLQDDGRGLDAAKILAKARRQRLVPEGPEPSAEEIYGYIFLPGFSTAEKVTSVSGRGVGMDVVKRNVEKLRGKIEIATELGKGSTFTIKLPLTMAIIDGLVVRVGEDRFILPSTSVQRALRPARDHIVNIQGCGEVLDLRGKLIPLRRLHRHFGIDAKAEHPWEGILVVVESAGRVCALLVDEMVSKQEVVIKNLGPFMQGLSADAGVVGGAILGDGNIALILDPATLLRAA
ncbi:MAG: chemotaxis protein CheA [Opitutaceae bacterium]